MARREITDKELEHVLKEMGKIKPSDEYDWETPEADYVGPSGSTPKDHRPKTLTQYSVNGDGLYQATGNTVKILPPGFYEFEMTPTGLYFNEIQIKSDTLIRLKDSLADSIIDEIQMFWNKEAQFKKYGFTHHRGYLLYGAHGSGKTCIVQMVASDVIKAGDIVFICKSPYSLISGIQTFRKVEPNRRCVVIFEDIEAMIRREGDAEILSYLDGEYKIDKVLNIATTNYPELLDRRIVGRPRRFDRVIKIDYPGEASRLAYFEKKLDKKEAKRWAKMTDQLSFASLAELIISTKCLDGKLEETIAMLREMQTKFSPITDGESTEEIGFNKKVSSLNT